MQVDIIEVATMNESSDSELGFKRKSARTFAGIVFFMQILFFFMYSFNFNGLPLFLFIGWILLIPGFLLLGVSGFNSDQNRLKNLVSRLTPHPLPDGWLMVCVAAAMISQHWFSYICVLIQLPIIIFVFYYE
ncbi:MAG: hypothetical protein ACFFEK_15200 [Candidatus Thorarchaeota archaeon]